MRILLIINGHLNDDVLLLTPMLKLNINMSCFFKIILNINKTLTTHFMGT